MGGGGRATTRPDNMFNFLVGRSREITKHPDGFIYFPTFYKLTAGD